MKSVALIGPLFMAIAYTTLSERHVMGGMQIRRGPNSVGLYGVLQPFADALKLAIKEPIYPYAANKALFILAPIGTFAVALASWALVPFGMSESIILSVSNWNAGIIYLMAMSSISVYGILFSGWSSNSRYAFLGSLRSAAQFISYELTFGLVYVTMSMYAESYSISKIIESQEGGMYILGLLPVSIVYLIGALAETNRHPFDLPEAESELVSGYNTDYGAMGFTLFFLAEYSNILLMSGMFTILFLGGGKLTIITIPLILEPLIFALKIILIVFIFIWLRAALPRYRYDQLMRIGWQKLLPISLIFAMISMLLLWVIAAHV